MLDKAKILELALNAIEVYIDEYNRNNDAQVAIYMGAPAESDHGVINIDGGGVHGAWALELGEL